MPFVLKKFPAIKGKKIQQFLLNEVGLTMSSSQKLLAKKRVFDDQGNILQNGQVLKCDYIEVAVFEGHTRGLSPIFQANDFAIFDKPSGVMVHPTSRNTEYTLLDEIRYHFGNDANLAHRIDAETSGLVLVTKNRYADMILKTMFEEKEYSKEYLAIVKGELKEDIVIDSPISKSNGMIGVKMTTENENGKESTTYIYPLEFNAKNNTTLVKAVPITGRQHQIRVHLDSIGHTILGDPIYGIDEKIADQYLCKELSDDKRLQYTGASRLMLHANNLAFNYKDINYNIYSKQSL
ncbi:MAG: RluA family pseudouridine synthase [Campylobacteraceae bacterium]|jgi:23S rRNA pseudouridine1911/1915/1917 synthase|nr:RluA family pseudouridine synthase [Campylobacteraceae bacterium]MBT4030799.1 RluA family pseudouridine synthase [Campylobacteraceae bacterium]MBT4179793.1 RluA family pseudouridine synthase [Campylobacteraceae bacterium]MBT4707610.1 RluA family pseudouridine synthase [Campylobacteraceae bacterium]MBT5323565.1 RluA family pseudouridine synthase [Campylobacteraceae bacterium]